MAKLTTTELIDAFKELSLIELSEFVKAFEETFEVTAAAPVAAAAPAGAGGAAEVEAAKGLRDFAKANPALVIKGGVLDGRALTAADVTKLADLESREVLLAKAANVFKASLFQAAYLFTAPAAQAARTVDALRLKLEESTEVAA